MTINARVLTTTPDRVWDVLSDGWLYPLWVVGATRMRAVDASWPRVGSKIHHSVGVWPAVLDDDTEVLECDPGRFLRLRPRGWPIGEADVAIRLSAQGADTLVAIDEKAVSGPGSYLPGPVKALSIKIRNVESLRRLAFLAEGRSKP